MRFHKTKIYLFFFLSLFGLTAYFSWPSNSLTPMFSTTTSLQETNTSWSHTNSPIYLQNDPRWKEDKIGGSQETLGAVGCTVCCVSMALAHYGIYWPPDKLNALLKKHQGYTSQGWLKWHTVSRLTHHAIEFSIPNQPHWSLIDAALQANEPVIAKIKLYGLFFHWVLIVKKQDNEYWVKDPLGDGKTLDKLSQFNSKIYAIRIVENNNTSPSPLFGKNRSKILN